MFFYTNQFFAAVSRGNNRIIKRFLVCNKFDSVNVEYIYEIIIFKYYLQKIGFFNGISYKLSNKTPLYIAAEKQNIDMIKLLLTCEKIDPNSSILLLNIS